MSDSLNGSSSGGMSESGGFKLLTPVFFYVIHGSVNNLLYNLKPHRRAPRPPNSNPVASESRRRIGESRGQVWMVPACNSRKIGPKLPHNILRA
jgi:hypothetical protein